MLWNVDSEDWKNKDAAATTALIMKQTKPGSIILMHDIWPSTAEALPSIISKLMAAGYTPVTLPELVGSPVAGRVYHGQSG